MAVFSFYLGCSGHCFTEFLFVALVRTQKEYSNLLRIILLLSDYFFPGKKNRKLYFWIFSKSSATTEVDSPPPSARFRRYTATPILKTCRFQTHHERHIAVLCYLVNPLRKSTVKTERKPKPGQLAQVERKMAHLQRSTHPTQIQMLRYHLSLKPKRHQLLPPT